VGDAFVIKNKADKAGTLMLTGWNQGDNRRAVQTLVFTEAGQ